MHKFVKSILWADALTHKTKIVRKQKVLVAGLKDMTDEGTDCLFDLQNQEVEL